MPAGADCPDPGDVGMGRVKAMLEIPLPEEPLRAEDSQESDSKATNEQSGNSDDNNSELSSSIWSAGDYAVRRRLRQRSQQLPLQQPPQQQQQVGHPLGVNFDGVWELDTVGNTPPGTTVSSWLFCLRITGDTVVDGDGCSCRLRHVGDEVFFERGRLELEDGCLKRTGRSGVTYHYILAPP